MVKEIISPAGSLTGFSFKTWVYRNKDTLKVLVMAGAAIGSFAMTKGISIEWQALIVPLTTGVAKLIVDTLDFFANDVKL